LCGLEVPTHPDLLVGLATYDDAGVFRLRDDLALIQTLDFFTPIVDDPHTFGQIAAANAMSDVYAMGGEPLTAMNIICFPIKTMDVSVLREILKGGLEKITEAGAFLVGGHSVEDDELKYGLSVTGVVHPGRVFTNRGAKPGDHLILTKPIGTGIINTAIKGNLAGPDVIKEVSELMATLNRWPADRAGEFGVSACTDVTGFGLLGHACEMIEGEPVGLRIEGDKVPVIPGAWDFAGMGMVPAGTHRNRSFRESCLGEGEKVDPVLLDILFDPQTSGGLLLAVKPEGASHLVECLQQEGCGQAAVIGEFVPEPRGKILIQTS
jgi:selenide,water dikinase